MVRLILGDCLEKMKKIESGTVQTCVTSPPYYGLRDYGTGKWEGGNAECDHVSHEIRTGQGMVALGGKYRGGGHKAASEEKTIMYRDVCAKCGARRVDRQIGLEQTPDEYVQKMVDVFREVWRVLRDDGTVWLNLGDSYNAAGRDGHGVKIGYKQGTNRASMEKKDLCRPTADSLKPKDLIGIPWRVAFALQADGWYLRQDIIWHKPNPMPESVTDRCTKSHEYIFLLSKSQKYFYDAEAIKETAKWERWGDQTEDKKHPGTAKHLGGKTLAELPIKNTKNKRSVWTVSTKPFKEAHFAVFPPDLIKPCILAGSRNGDVVLDPFTGSGTTGVVSVKHGRSFIGCELNKEYMEMANKRILKANQSRGLLNLIESRSSIKRKVAPLTHPREGEANESMV